MRAWLTYAGASAAVLAVGGLVLAALLPAGAGAAVVFAGVSALGIQILAFGALVAVRDSVKRFMVGWIGGVAFRFVALVALGFWATRRASFPAEPGLLALVAFLFVLLLMEPVFLRMAD